MGVNFCLPWPQFFYPHFAFLTRSNSLWHSAMKTIAGDAPNLGTPDVFHPQLPWFKWPHLGVSLLRSDTEVYDKIDVKMDQRRLKQREKKMREQIKAP